MLRAGVKEKRKKYSTKVSCPFVINMSLSVADRSDPRFDHQDATVTAIRPKHGPGCAPGLSQLIVSKRARGRKLPKALLLAFAELCRAGVGTRQIRRWVKNQGLNIDLSLRAVWNLRYAVKYAVVRSTPADVFV